MESVVGELAAELKGSSDLRPGEAAELVGLKLEAAPPAALARKADSTRFILYLSKETWLGDAGDALAEEVRKARAIGISNFNASMIDELVQAGLRVKPAVNQCGFSIGGHNASTYGRDYGARARAP